MSNHTQQFSEEFVRLALAINEHSPGYVDAYFGPEEWAKAAEQGGKLPLPELEERAEQLALHVSQASDLDEQRKDFLVHQLCAMQMSLRLLMGEEVSLAEEVQALYDVVPAWKDESIFMDIQKELDQMLPGAGPVKERLERWNKSLELSMESIRELLPVVTDRLRELTNEMFPLPAGEAFRVEFVSDQPWMAYNLYQGEYQSIIEVNTDLPIRVNGLVELLAHEGYPGHHTELCLKELNLIRQKNDQEHVLTLINSPAAVIAEGIATTALETILAEAELEDWYRKEILPRAGMPHIDAARMIAIHRAERTLETLSGNAAFMMYDQKKSPQEVKSYAQTYGLNTEQEADHLIRFISNPLDRSYIFTYFEGRELLEELFSRGDRKQAFARLLTEPVTPSQIRQWIENESRNR